MFAANAGKYRKVNKVLSLQNLDFGITYWNVRQPILTGKHRKKYIKLAHCVSIIMIQGEGQDNPTGLSSSTGEGWGKINQLGYLEHLAHCIGNPM